MAHNVNIREEVKSRQSSIPDRGELSKEFRATCSCGWTEKSKSKILLEALSERHAKFPHRII
jgi:hypothetical protein